MIPIKYVEGDATAPCVPGPKIIAHVVNDGGVWGAGFVMALSAVDRVPQAAYRLWYDWRDLLPEELDPLPFKLGNIQFSTFANADTRHSTYVCNMLAQKWYAPQGIPLQYDALRHCLRNLARKAEAIRASIHMPRIGCGLAGGDWKEVSKIILQEVSAHNNKVTVYDLPRVGNQTEGTPA